MTADELCFTATDFESLQAALLPSDDERCAVLFAAESRRTSGQVRLLVREIEYPALADYSRQGVDHAELSPAFVARVAKKALTGRFALIFVHTHPGAKPPTFSAVDDRGERALAEFLAKRGLDRLHAALVMSDGGVRARQLGQVGEMRVLALGAKRTVAFDPELDEDSDYSPIFDRQVRAFGASGQRRLGQLSVAVVGLGGTGSIATQQLMHLGIRRFVLIDPDVVEETNLNRVVGATPSDVGHTKVSVALRYLRAFLRDMPVTAIEADVTHDSAARSLIDADLIFCCTDSHASRSVVQQVSYQHLIPCVDVGSTITQTDGEITGIFGRVQLLAPGLPCLWCSALLDAAEVRRGMMSESERRLDPYIVGGAEPAPSVISLNGTVVSLGVSMLLGIVAGAPIDATHLIYNARSSTLRSVRGAAEPDCFICSRTGVLSWGSEKSLFSRRD
jgi:molybdopterin/thiamine biosynthesis adenylyltransferase